MNDTPTVTEDLRQRPWTDIPNEDVTVGTLARIGVHPATQDSPPTVMFLISLPSGRFVLAQTTLRTYQTAAHVIAVTPIAKLEDHR